jgi:hypothetical protein
MKNKKQEDVEFFVRNTQPSRHIVQTFFADVEHQINKLHIFHV